MGIRSVAIFSDEDTRSAHVKRADEAYNIGPAAAAESYLNMKRIIDIAKQSGSDAIHPGYGFLSENEGFAKICKKNGIIFIGPGSEAMEVTGDKMKCKEVMKDAGVPLVPGSDGVVADLDEAVSIAIDCGFPVLLKSAFGGGGRGIRLAKNEKELRQEYEMASTESKAAFGKAALYVEKCLEGIRHIEYQLVRDTHGNSRHLFERECSVQRRHQKLIEMSPSPVLDTKTRNKIGDIAVRAVDAVDYVNAGTAEFLRDNKGNFYFIEINSRLQVEHPVTELVTGLDLVKLQISIAQGEKIPFKQEELNLRGAAIECRINAEDPYNEFSPSVGLVPSCNLPYGPGVRVDSYLYPGCTVSGYYDSLIAKLITWGNYFEEARSRMINALNEFEVEGINTTIPLYKTIMKEEHFIRGELSTDYLERYALMDKLFKDTARLSSQFQVPALAALLLYSEFRRTPSFRHGDVRTNTDVPAWIRQREIF